MKEVILSVDQANMILAYLSKKPFAEVYELIAMIQTCTQEKKHEQPE